MVLPSKNDSTSTLDIVVETLVAVSVTVQVLEGLLGLKVLKLDDHLRVDLLDGRHELVHELLLLLDRRALLTQA